MRLWLAAILLLLAAGPAAADPAAFIALLSAGASVGAAGSAAFGAIGWALIKVGLGQAFSALQQALAPKPKVNNPGIQTESTTQGGTLPQTFIIGRYATAGNLVAPFYTHGQAGRTPNAYLTMIIDLSDLPVTALTGLWIAGVRMPRNPGVEDVWTGPVHADYGQTVAASGDTAKYSGRVWLKFYDGSQAAADPMLVAKYGAHPTRPWAATAIGIGVAYAILTVLYDREVWQSIPDVRFEVDGIRVYDPRKDSSVGGAGTQRWADPASWGFSANPVVHSYNISRGLPMPDGSTFGLGVAAQDLPDDWWLPAMNACDVIVDGARRFRAGFEVRIATAEHGGNTPLDVIDELMKACSGTVCDMGGTWLVRVAEPGLPVFAFTDDDVIVSQPQDLEPFRGMAKTFNAERATYPEPAQSWAAKEAPPRYDTDAEAADGQRLVADLSLPAVPYGGQVQRLMQAMLKDERRQRRHNLALPPDAGVITPLDAVTWTSTRNGYTAKLFEIASIAYEPVTLVPVVAMRERDPADYDWNAGTDLKPSPLVPVTILDPAPVALPGFAAVSSSRLDASGAPRRPGLRISWSPDLLGLCASVQWEVKVNATGAAASVGSTTDIGRGLVDVTEGILPGVAYAVRARGWHQETAWSAWQTVTVANLPLSGADLDLTGQVDVTAFAAGTWPVEVLASLPPPPHHAGRQVFLTTDQKLYRNTGSGWTVKSDGADILAGTILATSMRLTDWENLFPGGAFSDGSTAEISLVTATISLVSGGLSGATRLRFEKDTLGGSGTMTAGTARLAVVQEGETYWFECVAQAASAMAAGFYFRIRFLDETGANLGFTNVATNAALPTSWTPFSAQLTIPASARFAQWEFVNWTTNAVEKVVYVDHVTCRRANAGKLVVDGTIAASKLETASMEVVGAAVFGTGLKSSNYAESGGIPTAGFNLVAATGEIKGKNIISGTPIIQGAVSQFYKGAQLAEVSANNTTLACATTVATGPISGDQNYIVGAVFEGKAATGNPASFNGVYLQKRVKPVGGAWTGWFTQTTHNPLAGYAVFAESFLLTDRLDDLQFRFLLANSDALNTVWLKNGNIQIQSVVK